MRARKTLHVSVDELRCRYDYDETSGILTKHHCPDLGQWNEARPSLGYKHHTGYWFLTIDGREYSFHRVVYAYVHGLWPDHEIDHINGDRSDNRFPNLRPASPLENARNAGTRGDNSSGYKGVVWEGRNGGGWIARIQINGRRIYIGRFSQIEVAAEAYKAASARLFRDFCPFKSRSTANQGVTP